jgi:hypothetical protein
MEKFQLTGEERLEIVNKYIKNNQLQVIPSKEKYKIVILNFLIESFNPEKQYTEREINEVLKSFYPDFAILRRYLVDYKLLERSKDCRLYWVKK